MTIASKDLSCASKIQISSCNLHSLEGFLPINPLSNGTLVMIFRLVLFSLLFCLTILLINCHFITI